MDTYQVVDMLKADSPVMVKSTGQAACEFCDTEYWTSEIAKDGAFEEI